MRKEDTQLREEVAQLKATVVELRKEMEVRDTMVAHLFQGRMDELRGEMAFLRDEMEEVPTAESGVNDYYLYLRSTLLVHTCDGLDEASARS